MITEKADLMNAQAQALTSTVASIGIDVPRPVTVAEVHIGTPPNQPQPPGGLKQAVDPYQVAADPWVIAAESNRVQTSQSGTARACESTWWCTSSPNC